METDGPKKQQQQQDEGGRSGRVVAGVGKLLEKLRGLLSRKTLGSLFRLISLATLVYTVLVFLLQIYLIYNRFRLLRELNAVASHAKSTSSASAAAVTDAYHEFKLNNSIIINAFLITFSLLCSVLFLAINAFKIGIYSHDNSMLGRHFDKSMVSVMSHDEESTTKKAAAAELAKASTASTSSTASSSDSTASSTKKWRRLARLRSIKGLSALECCLFRRPKIWWQLPPLGACFHLLSALFLLIAEVQLSSKRIQLGYKPVGDMFGTKLDFMFGEPISRLKQFQAVHHQATTVVDDLAAPSSAEDASLKGAASSYALGDLIQSKDDFSVFSTITGPEEELGGAASARSAYASLLLLVTSTTIGLDYLNFLLALLAVGLKMAQVFWHTAPKFSLLVFAYAFAGGLLTALSYGAYEILFKVNSFKKISKNFLFTGAATARKTAAARTPTSVIFLNSDDTYFHDFALTLIYLFSTFLLFASIYLNVKYGYRKFEKLRARFESSLFKYVLSSLSVNGQRSTGAVSLKRANQLAFMSSASANRYSLLVPGNSGTFSAGSSSVLSAAGSDAGGAAGGSTANKSRATISTLLNSIQHQTEQQIVLNLNGNESLGSPPAPKEPTKTVDTESAECVRSFKYQLISSGLFLVYCCFRSLFIYEMFIVLKYSNDGFLIAVICSEFAMILLWVATVILLTVSGPWTFALESSYKLVYWNWTYHHLDLVHNISGLNQLRQTQQALAAAASLDRKDEKMIRLNAATSAAAQSSPSSSSSMSACLSDPNLNLIGAASKQTAKKSDYANCGGVGDYEQSQTNSGSSIQLNLPNQTSGGGGGGRSGGGKGGLMVRDDSVLLSRSSNMSSSSITEVSSLMPNPAAGFLSQIGSKASQLSSLFSGAGSSAGPAPLFPSVMSTSSTFASTSSTSSSSNTSGAASSIPAVAPVITRNSANYKMRASMYEYGGGGARTGSSGVHQAPDGLSMLNSKSSENLSSFLAAATGGSSRLDESLISSLISERASRLPAYLKNGGAGSGGFSGSATIGGVGALHHHHTNAGGHASQNEMVVVVDDEEDTYKRHEVIGKLHVANSDANGRPEAPQPPSASSSVKTAAKTQLDAIIDEEEEPTTAAAAATVPATKPAVVKTLKTGSVATIGEIMEPALNVRDRQTLQIISNQTKLNASLRQSAAVSVHGSTAIGHHNESSHSSSSVTDSGRDSLADSPVNTKLPLSASPSGSSPSASSPVSSSSSSSSSSSAGEKPFYLPPSATSTNNNNGGGVIVLNDESSASAALNKSSHLFDTRC